VLGFIAIAAFSDLAWGTRSTKTVTAPSDQAASAAAEQAYAELQRRFSFGNGLYAASDARSSYAHAWPLSQALSASFAFSSLPGRTAAAARTEALNTIRALAHYRLGLAYNSVPRPPLDRGGELYFDDQNWIALDLLAGYQLFGSQAMLRRAEGVFRFLVSGWDTKAGDACPGGVFWARPPLRQIRTTVSTANAALVAARLYEATGKPTYLAWAQRMYDWVSRCLAAPDGLYYDHINHRGNVSRREYTYNQGAMIAAGVLLARATQQSHYLDQAQATAQAALAHYGASGYKSEPPIFVAIFFSDLNTLRQAVLLPEYQAALRDYLRRHVTLGAKGHFGSSLVFQAAAAQLYSLAAVPPP
jgi:hypothetical protein